MTREVKIMIGQFKLLSAPVLALALAAFAPQVQAKSAGEGQSCGGIAGLQCGAGLYCEMPAGMCHKPDSAGVCRMKPDVCPQNVVRVCGCDGKTYTNACRARQAGVSIASTGACPKG
jgi:hypothetical protein